MLLPTGDTAEECSVGVTLDQTAVDSNTFPKFFENFLKA